MTLASEALDADDPLTTKDVCDALGLSRATLSRRRKAQRDAAAGIVKATPAKKASHRKLSVEERKQIYAVLCSPEFINRTPAFLYAELLGRHEFLCSIRSMYRILNENQDVVDRRDQRKHPKRKKPRVVAEGPNEVWTWDISKLPGPVKGVMFCLYVAIDLYSRRVVGWMIADTETNAHAQDLFRHAVKTQGIERGQITVHSDNGAPMTSHGLAGLFESLGISTSFSRPRVSNDNPFSEAFFKTCKYTAEYPGWFASRELAEAYFEPFFDWYNHEHHHSGLGLFTPDQVHTGEHLKVQKIRQAAPGRGVRPPPQTLRQGPPDTAAARPDRRHQSRAGPDRRQAQAKARPAPCWPDRKSFPTLL